MKHILLYSCFLSLSTLQGDTTPLLVLPAGMCTSKGYRCWWSNDTPITALKKILLFLTFTCFLLAGEAQNWPLFKANEVYHYRLSQSNDSISHSLYIDSVYTTGSDSVFCWQENFRTYITTWGDTGYIRHSPHFLGQYFTKKPDFQYILHYDNQKWTIFPDAGLGVTWIFDSTTNVTATVSAIQYSNLFASQDSLKTISLSNGKTIQIAKNLGIIHFPNLQNTDEFMLCGLQNTQQGTTLPTISEIYDFEVGDVFFYRYRWWAVQESECQAFKKEVINKVVLPNMIIYTYKIDKRNYHSYNDYACSLLDYYPNLNTFSQYNETDTVFFSIPSVENKYSGVKTNIFIHKYKPLASSDYFSYSFIKYGKGWQGGFALKSTNLYFPSSSDSLGGDYSPQSNSAWQRNLGLIYLTYGQFEGAEDLNLIGYIKNGISYGTTYPDWYYTDIQPQNDTFFTISPNPVQDKLHIESPKETACFWILDLTGRVIIPKTDFSFQQEVSGSAWAKGVYFLQMQDENGNIHTEKFIKE